MPDTIYKEITYNTMAKLILYQAKSPYKGDVTKNCALTGKEVDNNFLNLKGEDIEKIYLDEDTKKLTFTRFKNGLKNCNGETIESKIEVDLTELEYVTGYVYEDGVIKICYSNGKTAEMPIEAFGMSVATDSTISGNGSKSNPLSISQAMRTGQYEPVKGIVNIVDGERLPSDAVDGDGYVTHEVKSDFGLFYTSDQALLLEGILRSENSEWRVPSKKDWDTLLNYLEDCDKYKNHSLRSENEIDARGMSLGNLAGWKAKSLDTDEADYWVCGGTNNADFLRIYPSGSFSPLTGAYSGFGNHAQFWTLTEGDMSCRNFYSKKFLDLKGTVTQVEAMPASKLTIRLVKNFIGDNYHKYEEIHGRIYETKLVASETDECNQVWTMVNIDISDAENELIPTPIPENATSAITMEYAYYINRWNGYEWDKTEMSEGDCVVILDGECGEMSEYRLECGELVNRDEFWQNQIDNISGNTGDVYELLQEEVSARAEGDTILQEQIDELSGTTENLQNQISDEISARTESDEHLQDEIDELMSDINEISATTEELRSDIDELSGTTQDVIDDINEISGTTQDILATIGSGFTPEVTITDVVGEGFTDENGDIESITDVIREDEQTVAIALNDLNDRVRELGQFTDKLADDIYALQTDIGRVNDVPGLNKDGYFKNVFDYSNEDLASRGGELTVFKYINASNDYGYNEENDA